MTTYTGVVRAKHATLTANTVDVVTFTRSFDEVEVVNRGAEPVWFRTDATAPTVGGDDTYVVMPGGALRVDVAAPMTSGPTVVRVIAGTATDYSVTGL